MGYCKDFAGGYCDKINMGVPKGFCVDVCKGDWGQYKWPQKPTATKIKRQPPTVSQMAQHFTKAMIHWAKKGFPVVDKTEYIRRRTICSTCSGGWKCPKCGCMLWGKSALQTQECEKWEK